MSVSDPFLHNRNSQKVIFWLSDQITCLFLIHFSTITTFPFPLLTHKKFRFTSRSYHMSLRLSLPAALRGEGCFRHDNARKAGPRQMKAHGASRGGPSFALAQVIFMSHDLKTLNRTAFLRVISNYFGLI
jgi:hypothetical protein